MKMDRQDIDGRHRGLFWITAVLVSLLFLSAFVLSFDALLHLARDNGISPKLAWLWPLGLDAFMAASSLAVVWASLNQAQARWYRALAGMAFAMSIAGNYLHAEPSNIARAVAILPPIVTFLSFETLMGMVRHETARAGVRSAIVQLEAVQVQLTADTEEAQAELKSIRDKAKSTYQRIKTLRAQEAELEQSIKEMEEAEGDPKILRHNRIRAIQASANGKELTQQALAEKVGCSLSTLKRDLAEIQAERVE